MERVFLFDIYGGEAGAQYLYNAAGKRMGKRVSGTGTLDQTVFAYDEAGQLIGAYTPDSAGINGIAVQEELVWLDPWRPVATARPDSILGMQSPQIHPIFTDHLGTPMKIVNQDGFTVWTWDAKEPFGMQSPNQDPSSLGTFEFNSRFPGQWFDEESGLSHNGFRDYHPGLGRYVQSDPIGLEAGWNTYGYAGMSPSHSIDPFGLEEVMVAIWLHGYSFNPGHVYAGNMEGTRTYSSQFPENGDHGKNLTFGRRATAFAEKNRYPDALYAVDIPDIESFKIEAERHRNIPRWSVYSFIDPTSTSCTEAAVSSFYAGGFKMLSRIPFPPTIPQVFPKTMKEELDYLSGRLNSRVRKLNVTQYRGVNK